MRIGRYLSQFVITREDKVQNVVNTESTGVGVRVIANGTWGFAATSDITTDGLARAARRRSRSPRPTRACRPSRCSWRRSRASARSSWATPIEKNAMEVPIKDKVDLLLGVNAAAMQAGASFINSILFLVNEQKYFASTDGSYIDQDVHRIWAPIQRHRGRPEDRQVPQSRRPVARRAAWATNTSTRRPAGKVGWPGGADVYPRFLRHDGGRDAAAPQAQGKADRASRCKPGKYDLVLDPSHLWLTIHESVGHPTELDRVLGYEANYAGTSFATLDKWQSKKFKYGSDQVTIFADKTQPDALGAVGYDDEGVKTQALDLIKDGILVNYQEIRDQAHILGQKASHGCCYADSWSDVQFQRMPNVSLQPGKAPLTPAQMIQDVEKGIYIIGDGSFSIDQQRYNFQFSGKLFYEIKGGKIGRHARRTWPTSPNTQEFWNSCVGRLRRAGLPPRRLVLRRQGRAGPGQRRVARLAPPRASTASTCINTARKDLMPPAHRSTKPARSSTRRSSCPRPTSARPTSTATDGGNIRFARNTVSTSRRRQNDRSLVVQVKLRQARPAPRPSTSSTTRRSSGRAARRGAGAAGAGRSGVHAADAAAAVHRRRKAFFDATAAITPDYRAEAAADSIEPCRRTGAARPPASSRMARAGAP